MASDLALSPSVRMSVHRWLLRVPASLASSSLGMPVIYGRGGGQRGLCGGVWKWGEAERIVWRGVEMALAYTGEDSCSHPPPMGYALSHEAYPSAAPSWLRHSS